jgi:hypothetical protein
MKKPVGKMSPRNDNFDLSVIVDFIFEDGLFFISIRNIGDDPAFKVTIEFDKKITGVCGRKEISYLPLFKNIEFLAPHKEIKTFLDTSESYFNSKQPENISVKISYKNKEGKLITGIINHDLGIYKEIGYIKNVEKENQINKGELK